MKSLVSSRVPDAGADGGAARSVGAEGVSPPCREIRTSSGFNPRNQLIASTAIRPTPPSLNPPRNPPAGPPDSRSSTLPLPRISPQRTVIPPPAPMQGLRPVEGRRPSIPEPSATAERPAIGTAGCYDDDMPKRSAGLLMYRRSRGAVEVLL